MVAATKKTDLDALRQLLKDNPDLLREALKGVGVKTGVPKYTLIKTEKGIEPTKRLEGTRIVEGPGRETTFYTFRMPNDSIVRIPESTLADYHISLDKIPMMEEDTGDK